MSSQPDLNTYLHEKFLCRCQSMHGTDKGFIHSYIVRFYGPIFKLIQEPAYFLEVGIARGASLLLWHNFFPHTKLTGIDINTTSDMHRDFDSLHLDKNVNLICSDAYKSDLKSIDSYDFIIDDGPHTLESQVNALKFISILNPKGVLVIEDVPNVAKRLKILKSTLPTIDQNYLKAVSFSHLSGRYDDALIVYTRNHEVLKWLENECQGTRSEFTITDRIFKLTKPALFFVRIRNKFFGKSNAQNKCVKV